MINEKPPFFKTWNTVYLILAGFLAVQIAFYYFITKFFL
jgi:hypothetical protein